MNGERTMSVLRVSMVVVAIALLFTSGLISPVTRTLSRNTFEYLAAGAVGVVAQVEPNEFNTLTVELTKRERELDAREAALAAREIDARDFGDSSSDYSTYILSIILFLLTVLVMLNYALDWWRAHRLAYEK